MNLPSLSISPPDGETNEISVSVSVLVPTIGIIISETFLYLDYTDLALGGYVITLLISTLAPLRMESDIPVFQSFVLIPAFRLVNLGMPVFFELTLYWFPFVYGPLMVSAILISRNNPAIQPSLGVKKGLALSPICVVLGALLAEIEYAIVQPSPLIPTWTTGGVVVLAIIMVGLVSLFEEILFRGILQETLCDRLGAFRGVLLASLIFGLMHSGTSLVPEFLFGVGVGMIYGTLYYWTNSLILTTIVHGTINIFLLAVLPLQGSFVLLSSAVGSL